MFIHKNRTTLGDRSRSPLAATNPNHTGSRLTSVRRVDHAYLKRHVVGIRSGTLPKSEIRKYENAIFEEELHDWQDKEQLPPYHDNRFDIPHLKERVDLGRRRRIPRRIRRDDFRTLAQGFNIDGAQARSKLSDHSDKAFITLQNATWQRNEWTKARHMEVRIEDCPMDSPMPTHFMRVSTHNTEEIQNLLTPIHSTFLRGHWGRLNNLPEFAPMDICTPINQKGELLPNDEYASGELPMINVRVHNLETMPHLVAYAYQRKAGALVEQLVGSLATDFHQYVEQPQSVEQRQMEWKISQKIGALFDEDLIRVHSWFINDLAENANCVGMDDPAFWWALDVSMRIIMDALVVQRRFTTSSGNQSDEDESEEECPPPQPR